jgi:hypothetical protein
MNAMIEDFRRWQLWFPMGFVLIAAVSVYDIFLSLKYQQELPLLEQNPIGLWLIRLGGGEVGVFMRIKAAGTILVMLTLLDLMRRQSRFLLPVTGALTSAQAVLLLYLTLG